MKKSSKMNYILTFVIGLAMFLIGCAGNEVTFLEDWTVAEEELISEESFSMETTEAELYVQQEQMPVMVHICGAVVLPGVYELPAGSRIVDAVDMAGGMTKQADNSYVNLAGFLADGDQIYIPTREEAVILKQTSKESFGTNGKVNINTADKTLLCTLPGIGSTRAAEIIAYRQKHGKFSSIEDIMQVSGIKEGSFQKIKELIVVN